MKRFWIAGMMAVLAGVVGCGQAESTPESIQAGFDRAVMDEVADMYRTYILEFKKPPAKVSDLKKYEMMNGNGFGKIRDGEIVVLWGTPLNETDEGAKNVLAYEKATLESGGVVLMQDGTTVTKMDADQAKASIKAPTKAK